MREEEIFRTAVTPQSLSNLKPVFAKDGTVTAGNSCALCDAASAVVLMERSRAASCGLKPMALVRGYSFVGVDPRKFGISPVKAIPAALKKAGLLWAISN